MAENIPNPGKEVNIQVQEAKRVSNKINPKRNTPRHITIKMIKVKGKETILRAAKRKTYYAQKKPYKALSRFSRKFTVQKRMA